MIRRALVFVVTYFALSQPGFSQAQTPKDASAKSTTPTAPADAAPAAGTADEPADAPMPAEAAPASAPTTTSDPAVANSALENVRLKAIEQQVNDLKQKIFHSKERLNILKETVLHGTVAGSRAIIRHKNLLGNSFRILKVAYSMDGQLIFSKADDSGDFFKKEQFEIFNGGIVPGNHTVTLHITLRGNGYGVFSYVDGYQFAISSSHTFAAADSRQTDLNIEVYEKGNFTTRLEERPDVRFKMDVITVGKKAQADNK